MNDLLLNIDKVHTTELGAVRIKRNLNIDSEVVDYCKKIIINDNSKIYKKGKNWYIENNNIKITVNSYNYSIITGHKLVNR